MKRGTLLGVLIGVGALSLVVAGYQGQEGRGRGRGEGRGEGRGQGGGERGGQRGEGGREGRGQQAPPGRLVDVTRVKENLYMMAGGGGNTAVLVTDNGVVVVDTKLPGWGQPVLEKIKGLTDKPITTIINTHTHPDHVSGQIEYPGANVEVVAHETTKANMEKMDAFKQANNAKWLPSKTFKDKTSLGAGKDRIDLYYFGPAHTGGDAWVVFPTLRVIHAGDVFAGKSNPLVDVNNGGSQVHYPETLAKAVAGLKDADFVITGHSTLMTFNELKEYAAFMKDFVAWAQAEKKAGKTVEAAAAEYKVPDKYKGYMVADNPLFGGFKANVQDVYDNK
jgi:glyoxylase-like metal-dependent hydrolase (beta-lactamase superfamily II)